MHDPEKFKDKYRIPSTRLRDWDYGSPGLYFVTICTKKRHPYFGQIVETQDIASPLQGRQNDHTDADAYVQSSNIHSSDTKAQNLKNYNPGNPNTETKNFACFNADPAKKNVEAPNTETQNFASLQSSIIGDIANQYWLKIPEHFPFVELDEFVVMPNHLHGILFLNKPDYNAWQPNKFGPQSKNLGSVIRGYKAGVKTFAVTNQIDFAWQPRFHDRIIRSEKELNNIRNYILCNPEKWNLDKDNPESLMM